MVNSMDDGKSATRWSLKSAMLGGAAWAVLFAAAAAGRVTLGTIELLFLLAPLVIVPLGLAVAATLESNARLERLHRTLCFAQPFGAALAVASFWFAPGVRAGALAGVWLLVCALVGLYGLARLVRGAWRRADEACFAAGLLYLPIGGAWLLLSRLGHMPMGFQEPIVLLTAVHFHYTGFAAPLLAGAAGRALARRPASALLRALFRFVALGVIAGPPLVAAGFVLSPALKFFSALVLAASLCALALITLAIVPAFRHRPAQVLLAISAASVVAGMLLALVYAVGEFRGHLLISIPWMAATHGILNGPGFALCGLLGWFLADRRNDPD